MSVTAFEFAQEFPGGSHFTTDVRKAAEKLRELADRFERPGSGFLLQSVKVSTEAYIDEFAMTHVHIEFAEIETAKEKADAQAR